MLGQQGGRVLGDVRGIRIVGNPFEGDRYAQVIVTRAFDVVSEGNAGA